MRLYLFFLVCVKLAAIGAFDHDISHGRKIVHFLRHAEGFHNQATEDGLNQQNSEFYDASLNSVGVDQCAKLNNATAHIFNDVQLLLISPLRRTIQTAIFTFPQLLHRIPWIAVEILREQTSKNPADHRHSVSQQSLNFPHISFENMEGDEDTVQRKYPDGEPDAHVVERAAVFLRYLANRPEKEVIVVSHGNYLFHLFNHVLTNVGEEQKVYFQNCEIRSFVLDLTSFGEN